jgi:hypothetical protein
LQQDEIVRSSTQSLRSAGFKVPIFSVGVTLYLKLKISEMALVYCT